MHRLLLSLVLVLAASGRLSACTDWEALGPVESTPWPARAVESWNERLVLATDGEIQIVDPLAYGGPAITGSAPLDARNIMVQEDLVIGFGRWGSLWVLDLLPDGDPILRATVNFADDGWATSAALAGDVLFVSTAHPPPSPFDNEWSQTRAVDLSDPDQPQVLGAIGQGAVLSTLQGYLVMAGDSISILDVSVPAQPLMVGYCGEDTHLTAMRSDGTRLAGFSASGGRLHLFELSDPHQPFVIASLDLPASVVGQFGLADLIWVNDEIVLAACGVRLGVVEAQADNSLSFCGTIPSSDDSLEFVMDAAQVGDHLSFLDPADLLNLHIFSDPATMDLDCALVHGNAWLTWDPGSAGQWTVYRSSSPDFPPEQTERLGTTTIPAWIDPGAQTLGRAFYRVTMGRP